MLRYFISREFLFTLLGLFAVGIVVYIAIFFWILPAYTRHGDGLLVPDVSEMTVDEAEAELKKKGLRPMRADSLFIDHLPPGVIIKQYPTPFTRVKPNRTIALTINKSEPPMVEMPNLVEPSISLYQAKAKLEVWKLGVGKVTRVPDIAENVVLRAHYDGGEIQPGTKIPQGSKIDLVVGTMKNVSQVLIPDLAGYTYEDALSILRSIGLGLGSVLYNANGPEEAMGRIYSQNPKAEFGDSIRVGSAIDIYVYGSEPEENEGIIVEEVEN